MNDITVKMLAKEIKIPIDLLLQNLLDIGILKTQEDSLTKTEKLEILNYLNKKKLKLQTTLILQRKIRSTLNISSVGGKNKKVQIEVRKNESYIQENLDLNKTNKKNLILNNKNKIKHVKSNYSNTKCVENVRFKKNDCKNHKLLDVKNLSLKVSHLKSAQFPKKSNTSESVADFKSFISKPVKKLNILKDKRLIAKKKKVNKFPNVLKKNYISSTISDKKNVDNRYLNISINTHDLKNVKVVNLKKNIKNFEKKIDNNDRKSYVSNRFAKIKKVKGSYLQQSFQKPKNIISKDIVIGKTLLVSELANKMAVKSDELIKKMFSLGFKVSKNEIIDQETAQLIAQDMGHKVILHKDNILETMLTKNFEIDKDLLQTRPPVVTIMGHVDHGKTSLLDKIRSTKIAMKESGGITQHIGAYHIKINNNIITFIDTPGHSAFTAMRARGAQLTDIVVLVVAVDDGVKPQTIEAIQHAKAANVPIIVAINKIDKPNTNIVQIKNDLIKYNLLAEEWGGENIFVSISAKTGEGISTLLDAILLQAEILELKAPFTGIARGLVIESYLDKGMGPVATILIKEGMLKTGDIIICGIAYGKIRAMRDEYRKKILIAGPSIPVEVLGLSGMPVAGETVIVIKSEREARELAAFRKLRVREKRLENRKQIQLETLFEKIKEKKSAQLNIILKSDVQGSLEAISQSLYNLSTDKIIIKIISSGVGNITGTDVSLAIASNAIILGFNVKSDASAKKIVILENIDIRYYTVIYTLIDEVKTAMLGLLKPVYKQEVIGLAEVRNIFNSPKPHIIAGCMVVEGVIKRKSSVRILRNKIVIHEGELESLRRFKDDVNEIRNGMECGISIKNYNDISIGDRIEAFNNIEIKN